MEFLKSIKNLFFPARGLCYLCRENSPGKEYAHICQDCFNLLEPVHKEIDIDSAFLTKIYYTLVYNRYMRDIIRDYKFHGKSYLYKPLGELMLRTIEAKSLGEGIDLILYMPAHRRKEAKRGYNQAELLATYIGKELEIEVSHNNLVKTRYTKEQNKLSKLERMTNLRGAFTIRNREGIRGKRILLIDDIITTGTTMDEASRILIKNEAREVLGLALTSSRKL